MALVLAIIGGLVYSTTDSYQAYAARSNGNPAFKITLAPDCEEVTGHLAMRCHFAKLYF